MLFRSEINVNEFTFLSTKKEAGQASALQASGPSSVEETPPDAEDLPF